MRLPLPQGEGEPAEKGDGVRKFLEIGGAVYLKDPNGLGLELMPQR